MAWSSVIRNPPHAVTVSRIITINLSEADVIIEGYWNPAPAFTTSDHCTGSIACVEPYPGTYPHISVNQRFWIEDPPHWGYALHSKTWTTNFMVAQTEPSRVEYLPAILMHEFDHVLGIPDYVGDIMRGAMRRTLSDADKDALRDIYENHIPH